MHHTTKCVVAPPAAAVAPVLITPPTPISLPASTRSAAPRQRGTTGRMLSNNRSLDVARVRNDTPGIGGIVHLNNAGCALPTSAVVSAAKEWIDLEANIGGYEAVQRETGAMAAPYTCLAKLLNCLPDEIAVVQSATLAWQQVFFGLDFAPGDRILTSVAEYGSNYINFLQVAKRKGVVIDVIPEDANGEIDTAAMEIMMTSAPTKPRLVAITHIPTSSGRVYNAEAVGRVARRHGVLYLLDACQTVGQMPVNVQAIGCDFLSGTGRKYLRAPRGCGFLFASRSAMARSSPAMLDVWGAEWESPESFSMHPTARRYEAYEMSFAAKAGLGVAVQYALDLNIEVTWDRIQELAKMLRAGLADIAGMSVHDKGRFLCGIVSFTKEGVDAETIKERLGEARVNVSVSYRQSTLLDFDNRQLAKVVRASVHYYNDEQDIRTVLELLRAM